MADETLVAKEVLYCGVCTMPPEFCEFGGTQEKCKGWLKDNNPEFYDKIYGAAIVTDKLDKISLQDTKDGNVSTEETAAASGSAVEDKRTVVKDKSAALEAKLEKELKKKMASKIIIKRVERTKRKCVTTVYGLEVFDVDLKKAAKMFATKFACGSSVAKNNQGQDEIVVQGDFSDEIMDLITETWTAIPEDNIDLVEDKKAKK